VRRRWLIALFPVALTAVVTFLTWHDGARHTFYSPAEVMSAFSRSGLHLVPPGLDLRTGPGGPPDRYTPLTLVYRPPSGLFDWGQLRDGLPFVVIVVQRKPDLDASSNQRVLREAIRKSNELAALHPNQFHRRRGNVVVVGDRGLSQRVRHQLTRALRSLPNRGDPTVIGVSDVDV
jgi:hypothetical protein